MVFKSERQRKAFFAQKRGGLESQQPEFTVFSYRDGRKLGTFSNIQEVFKKYYTPDRRVRLIAAPNEHATPVEDTQGESTASGAL